MVSVPMRFPIRISHSHYGLPGSLGELALPFNAPFPQEKEVGRGDPPSRELEPEPIMQTS